MTQPQHDDRPPRLPKPESLEAKFKLLALLPYDRRAGRKHSLVYGFILDWFHSKYGDALASVRHVLGMIKERDPAGRGLYAGDVHSALSDLVAWGYLDQEKGSGRRASRYVPKWDLVCSVREIPNATDGAHSVRETPNASVREIPNATGASVRDSTNEDPSTVTRPQDGVTEIDGHYCAAPTAPPVSGLAAATAGTAQEGLEPFEQLWRAYDYKKNKREARAAFKKLAPDDALLSTMIAAATAWRASWAAQGDSAAPRYRLDKWLEREEYECDPPTGYKGKERKTKASEKPAAVKAAAVKALPGNAGELVRVLSAQNVGDPFSDNGVSIRFEGPKGVEEHLVKTHDNSGTRTEWEWVKVLYEAWGGYDEWPGRRAVATYDGECLTGMRPANGPDRIVVITEANLAETDGVKLLVGKLADEHGRPEGRLEIVTESGDAWEQAAGQKSLMMLFDALGVAAPDMDDLLFRPFMMTSAGGFKRAPEMLRTAA